MTDTVPTAPPEDAAAVESVAAPSPTDHVRAERVEITQGGVSSVQATTMTLQQGGAGRVRAGEFSVSQGGVGVARADRLNVNQGGSAFAVMADEATLAEGSQVLLLIAGSASGSVKPVIDWRAAAAFGAGLGLALRLLRRR